MASYAPRLRSILSAVPGKVATERNLAVCRRGRSYAPRGTEREPGSNSTFSNPREERDSLMPSPALFQVFATSFCSCAAFTISFDPVMTSRGPARRRTPPSQVGDRLPVLGTPMGRSVDRCGVVSLRRSLVRGGGSHRHTLGHRYRRRRAACRRGQMDTPWGSKKSSRS